MIKLATGMIIGSALTLIGMYLYYPPLARWYAHQISSGDIRWTMQQNAVQGDYSYRLGSALQPDAAQKLVDNAGLTISQTSIVYKVAAHDIASVCLLPVINGDADVFAHLTVEVRLTSQARQSIATALKPYAGKEMSFTYSNYGLSDFIPSHQTLDAFGQNVLEDPESPDFSFSAPPTATYSALTIARILSGKNALQMCAPSFDMDDIPNAGQLLDMIEADYAQMQKRKTERAKAGP